MIVSHQIIKPSDIYSFGILTHKVYFCTEPWPNVSMQLLNAVKCGHQPVIPANGSEGVTSIIKECWQQNSMLRSSASEVSRLMQEQLETESPISSVQNDLDDACVNDCISDVEMCADQNVHDEDTYTDLSNGNSSNLSHMSESNNAKMIVSRDSVSEENSHLPDTVPHSEMDENPINAQMITHGIANTCFSFSNNDLDRAKSILQIKELKEFQFQSISALKEGKDIIVVQPTGSGKSTCYTLPALLSSGKVAIVIEPVVAIITNQVDSLTTKGIDAVALGRAAGNSKSRNFHREFHSTSNIPSLAFCTAEYLFGTPPNGGYSGSRGQFSKLLARNQYVSLIAIDEAHKIFDRVSLFTDQHLMH